MLIIQIAFGVFIGVLLSLLVWDNKATLFPVFSSTICLFTGSLIIIFVFLAFIRGFFWGLFSILEYPDIGSEKTDIGEIIVLGLGGVWGLWIAWSIAIENLLPTSEYQLKAVRISRLFAILIVAFSLLCLLIHLYENPKYNIGVVIYLIIVIALSTQFFLEMKDVIKNIEYKIGPFL